MASVSGSLHKDTSDLSPFTDVNRDLKDATTNDSANIIVNALDSVYHGWITESGVPNSDMWEDGGTWTVVLNVSAGNFALRGKCRAVRVSSSGTVLQTGNWNTQKILTAGTKTYTVVNPSWNNAEEDVDNRLAVEFEFSNNDEFMQQTLTIGLSDNDDRVDTNIAQNRRSGDIDLFIHGHRSTNTRRVYWSDNIEDQIWSIEIDQLGFHTPERFISGGSRSSVHSMAVDINNGYLYFADSASNIIRKVDLDDGVVSNVVVSGDVDDALIYIPSLGKIYWSDGSTGGAKRVLRCNVDGTNPEVMYSGVYDDVESLAFDSLAEEIYWLDRSSGVISKTDYEFVSTEIVATGLFSDTYSIAIDPIERKLFRQTILYITKTDLDGVSNSENIFVGNVRDAFGIHVDTADKKIYWTDDDQIGDQKVARGNTDGTGLETIYTNATDFDPFGITVDPLRSLDLFAHGHLQESGNITLFTEGVEGSTISSGNIDLFIEGYSPASGSLDLYVNAHNTSSGSIDLFVDGHIDSSGTTTLFVVGHDSIKNYGAIYFTTEYGREVRRTFTDGNGYNFILDGSGVDFLDIDISSPDQDLFIVDAFGATDNIFTTDKDGENKTVLVSGSFTFPKYIGIHNASGFLFWADAFINGLIERSDLDGTNRTVIVSGLPRPGAIAVDEVNDRLYYSDVQSDLIRRCNLSGGNTTTIIPSSSGLNGNTTAIAIDPVDSKMYWIDQTTKQIYRSDLNGSNIETIISSTDTTLPNRMELDTVARKIYWNDLTDNLILRSNMDGSNIETFMFFHPQKNSSLLDGFIIDTTAFPLFVAGHQDSSGTLDFTVGGHRSASGALDLFTSGYDQASGTLDLFTDGHQQSSGSIDLVITGKPSGQIDLFEHGYDVASGSLDLFVAGKNIESGIVDLYAFGSDSASGSLTLFVSSQDSSSNTLNLFADGHITVSGNIDLFEQGHESASGTIDLSVRGHDTSSGSIDLFIDGDVPSSGSLDLFVAGHNSISGSTDLFVGGYDTSSGSVDLFVGGLNNASGTLSLFEQGYDVASGSVDLFINGNNISSGSLDLFVGGFDTSSGSIDLYGAGHQSISGDITLTIIGKPSGTIPLFISSLNLSSNNINLFIAGKPSGTIYLFEQGHEPSSGNIDLFINGLPSGTIDLFVDGNGLESGVVNLFVHGHESTASNKLYFAESILGKIFIMNIDGSNLQELYG